MARRETSRGFSKARRQAVWDKTGGLCWYCGTQTLLEDVALSRWHALLWEIERAHPIGFDGEADGVSVIPENDRRVWMTSAELAALGARPQPHPDAMTIDHQIPWTEGGTHHLSNLVPACRSCNGRKGTMSLEAFRAAEAARRGFPHFTQEHIAYLEKLQIQLPPGFPCYPQMTFWGEEHGGDA